MFGYYSLVLEGGRYFGNVSLNELHVFECDGDHCLLDVRNHAIHRISPHLASLVGRLAFDPACLVAENDMQELLDRNLVLLPENNSPVAKEGSEDAREASWEESLFSVNSLILFLCQECNLRCIYCFADGGSYTGAGKMSAETAFRAIDWLIENSKAERKLDICLFGGEPLLNFPVVRKAVSYAREQAALHGKEVVFTITTNGSLLDDEVIAFLRDEKIEPIISVDGPPEYQNRQRPFKNGAGSYDRIAANIRRLLDVIPDAKARATVYGDADPSVMLRGLEQMGFDEGILVRAAPPLFNTGSFLPETTEEESMLRMVAFHREEIDRFLQAVRSRSLDKSSPPLILSSFAGIATPEKCLYGCVIGKRRLVVTVNGDIYPCACLVGQDEARMGNIADYKADDPNEYYRAVVDTLPACRGCWARYLCGGGCFYRNKALTGDMHRPGEIDCTERKKSYEMLIHAYCQLDDSDRAYLSDILTVPENSNNWVSRRKHPVTLKPVHGLRFQSA